MVAYIHFLQEWRFTVLDTPDRIRQTRVAESCRSRNPLVYINLHRHVQGMPSYTVQIRWPRSVIEGLRLSALVFRHNKVAVAGGRGGRGGGDGHYSFVAAAAVVAG